METLTNNNPIPMNEVDELRQQLVLFKQRLDQQEIVNDRLLRRSMNARLNIFTKTSVIMDVIGLLVMPIILMAYTAQGSLQELGGLAQIQALLAAHGWTRTTAVCVLLFCLLHWPCSTTVLTVRRETGSLKWTLVILSVILAGLLLANSLMHVAVWLKVFLILVNGAGLWMFYRYFRLNELV